MEPCQSCGSSDRSQKDDVHWGPSPTHLSRTSATSQAHLHYPETILEGTWEHLRPCPVAYGVCLWLAPLLWFWWTDHLQCSLTLILNYSYSSLFSSKQVRGSCFYLQLDCHPSSWQAFASSIHFQTFLVTILPHLSNSHQSLYFQRALLMS